MGEVGTRGAECGHGDGRTVRVPSRGPEAPEILSAPLIPCQALGQSPILAPANLAQSALGQGRYRQFQIHRLGFRRERVGAAGIKRGAL